MNRLICFVLGFALLALLFSAPAHTLTVVGGAKFTGFSTGVYAKFAPAVNPILSPKYGSHSTAAYFRASDGAFVIGTRSGYTP